MGRARVGQTDTDRQTVTKRQRQTDRERERQRERGERERQRETERDRETERERQLVVLTRMPRPVELNIIESVDSISRDERDVPLTQYITNA